MPQDSDIDFASAAMERHFDGAPIEGVGHEGWAWFELDPVDPALGAGRAERNARRLTALFLAHWDNKTDNQRLVCLSMTADPPSRPRV